MKWIKIFDSWAEASSRLPENDPYILQIGEKKISIVRHGANLYAFEPLCPHQHEPLHKGTVNREGEIVCPLHAYRFNLVTGKEHLERCRDLETFPVKTDDKIYICID
jgi:nitrite reductase/ring-hydroxylating ferredoxin subunit